jgi:hypothetical protein
MYNDQIERVDRDLLKNEEKLRKIKEHDDFMKKVCCPCIALSYLFCIISLSICDCREEVKPNQREKKERIRAQDAALAKEKTDLIDRIQNISNQRFGALHGVHVAPAANLARTAHSLNSQHTHSQAFLPHTANSLPGGQHGYHQTQGHAYGLPPVTNYSAQS